MHFGTSWQCNHGNARRQSCHRAIPFPTGHCKAMFREGASNCICRAGCAANKTFPAEVVGHNAVGGVAKVAEI